MPTKAHKKGWKVAQKDIKKQKKTKLALVALSLVLLIILLGKSFQLVQKYTQPLTSEKYTKNYSWDGTSNINLVVKSSVISLVSFNPVDNKVTVVKIPDETYLKVSQKYGNWRLGSVYGLGQSEKPPLGNTLLVKSLSQMFALPVDGFLELNGSLSDKKIEDILKEFKQNPLSTFKLMSQVSSSLTAVELLRLSKGLSSVRFDKVKFIDLKESKLLDKTTLADDSEVLVPDPIKIDSISINFYETKIKEEPLTIAVYNATGYPGLAQTAARLIKNIGGNVIISSNFSNNSGKTLVVVKTKELEKSFTNNKLRQIFSPSCSINLKCDRIDTDPVILEEFRADINIIIGEDFYQSFN